MKDVLKRMLGDMIGFAYFEAVQLIVYTLYEWAFSDLHKWYYYLGVYAALYLPFLGFCYIKHKK